jgi:hypothetical protein
MPQLTPLQVAVPLAGTGQGVHDVPQEVTALLGTHALPQRWYPALQAKPHETPSQVATALGGGAGHGEHDVGPQEKIDRLEGQEVSQR